MKLIYLKLTVLFLLAVLPVAVFNYLIDPYGIFNNFSLNLWYEPGYEPNQHYAKMRRLINDKLSSDSYLFGSSRVGKINPDLIPEGKYYNMNYSEGLPGEHLDDIKVLLGNNIPVKNVAIGLDNFSYTMSPADHIDQIMRHPYDASEFNRFFFQIKYLYSVPRIGIIKNIQYKKSDSFINFNILGNGMHDLEAVDKMIESNIERHMQSDRFHKANNIQFDKENEHKYVKLMDDTVNDIAEIIKLSKKYHFKVHFFINPTYKTYYLQGNPYHFLIFKKKLAQITDYWDFSGLNSITTNNYYWYETSHYRTIVGDLITCRMFNCPNIDVPEDFGVFATNKTFESHMKKQKDELDGLSNL